MMITLLFVAGMATFALACVRLFKQRQAQAVALLPRLIEQLGYHLDAKLSLSPVQAAAALGLSGAGGFWTWSGARDFHGLPVHFFQGVRTIAPPHAARIATWSAPLRRRMRGGERVLERGDALLSEPHLQELLASLPHGQLTLREDRVEFSDPGLENLVAGLGGSIGHQIATVEGRVALLASIHERVAELLARLVLRLS